MATGDGVDCVAQPGQIDVAGDAVGRTNVSNAPLGSAICTEHPGLAVGEPIVSVRANVLRGRVVGEPPPQLQSELVEAGADVGGISHAKCPLSVRCERSSASSSFATSPSPVMSPMKRIDTVAD